jgi:hypothetical protein
MVVPFTDVVLDRDAGIMAAVRAANCAAPLALTESTWFSLPVKPVA